MAVRDKRCDEVTTIFSLLPPGFACRKSRRRDEGLVEVKFVTLMVERSREREESSDLLMAYEEGRERGC